MLQIFECARESLLWLAEKIAESLTRLNGYEVKVVKARVYGIRGVIGARPAYRLPSSNVWRCRG
jgi:hypothetical protein